MLKLCWCFTRIMFFFSNRWGHLSAMVGAIVLTLQKRDNPKRQSVAAQNARRRDESVEVVKVKPVRFIKGFRG